MPFIKRISFPGFIVGSIVDIVASNIWGVFAMIYVVAHYQLTRLPATEMTNQVLSIFKNDPAVFSLNLVCGGLCSILGGYVGAWIAKHDEILNGTLSCVLCVLSGIYGIATSLSSVTILSVLSLIISPALCAFGGYLRWLQNNRKRSPAASA
jgi:hypothetical protein